MRAPHPQSTENGLLISASVIVLVRAQRGPDGVKVVARAAAETPEGTVEATSIANPARLGQAIRELWDRVGARERDVSVVLSPAGYSMRALRFPDLPARERRDIVRGELEQTGAIPIGGGAFGFYWLSHPGTTGSIGQADVYAYYTGDAVMSGLRAALRQAGLNLVRVEPASIASMRAYLATERSRQPAALLCPAIRHSDLCIYDGAGIRLMRRLPTGWSDLGRMGAETGGDAFRAMLRGTGAEEPEASPPIDFDLRPPPAEPAPGRAALPEETPGFLAGSPDPEEEGVGLAAPQTVPFLAAEIARSLAFDARAHPDEARPGSLVLIGSPEVTRRMEQLLAGAQPLPVVAADILARAGPAPLPGSPAGHEEDYIAALGLACADEGEALGFPPVDLAWQTPAAQASMANRKVVIAGVGGSAIWLVAALAAAGLLAITTSSTESRARRLAGQIAAIERDRAPLLRYNNLVDAARRTAAQSRVPAAAVMGAVAASWNPGITLTRLDLGADGKISIEGRAVDSHYVQRFAGELGLRRTLPRPDVNQIGQDSDGGVTFRIAVALPRKATPAPKGTQ